MSEYLEDHKKMWVLREVAKEMPDGILVVILKMLDKAWDKEMQQLEPPKNKVTFVTKF